MLVDIRYWEDCTAGLRAEQTDSVTFCKSSYCCIGKQQADVIKWGRTTEKLWYKKLGTEHHGGITHGDTGRGLLSALLSSENRRNLTLPYRWSAPSFSTCKVGRVIVDQELWWCWSVMKSTLKELSD